MASSESNPRHYDLVLFGASGYTGEYTAEHIAKAFPTTLKWAVAGRSQQKLDALADLLQQHYPDRVKPGIEIVHLEKSSLAAIAKKTRVLLNCVGPFCLYGTPVVEACANNGTHYLDVTGESPWVRSLVQDYHEAAKANGAIIIPQIGVESSVPDMMTYAVVSRIREELASSTDEVILSLHDIKIVPSGGTLTTLLAIFEKYSLRDLLLSSLPNAMCPRPIGTSVESRLLSQRLFGTCYVPELGRLTTSYAAASDRPIVYRSWGLLSATNEDYGQSFRFRPQMRTRNAFTGALTHLCILLLPLVMSIPPIRWVISRTGFKPGQGPDRRIAENDFAEYRAIGIPDSNTKDRAFGRLRFEGSAYKFTGILMAEAAATLLSENNLTAKQLGGGVLTPATLGRAYIDRLSKQGVRIDTRVQTA